MNPESIPPEAQMMKILLGKWVSKPVYVAAKLEIADILAENGGNIKALSVKTNTHSGALYRMLRALAGVGIFKETETGRFVNTPLSKCLMKGRLKAAALLFHSDWHDELWDNLLYSIQTGEPAFEKVHGTPAFEWLEKHPGASEVFHEANAFKAAFSHAAIVDAYDFSGIHTVTDVGGGLGALMFALLNKNAGLRGVVAELPAVAAELAAVIKAKHMGNRMRALECDFFKEIPGGSDVYLLSHIIHDWPDAPSITILENCRKAMNSHGRLLIVEAVIPPGNDFSMAKLQDLEVLLMGGGRERSADGFQRIMERAGFQLLRIIPTSGDISLIEGIPC